MHKFDKISIEAILCCFLDAYLIVIMRDHFYFVYFRDQCEMWSKFCQIYYVWLLFIRVSKLWKIFFSKRVGSYFVRVKSLRLMEFLHYAQGHAIFVNETYFCFCVRCLN